MIMVVVMMMMMMMMIAKLKKRKQRKPHIYIHIPAYSIYLSNSHSVSLSLSLSLSRSHTNWDAYKHTALPSPWKKRKQNRNPELTDYPNIRCVEGFHLCATCNDLSAYYGFVIKWWSKYGQDLGTISLALRVNIYFFHPIPRIFHHVCTLPWAIIGGSGR